MISAGANVKADFTENWRFFLGLLDSCVREPLHERHDGGILPFHMLLHLPFQRFSGPVDRRSSDREKQEVRTSKGSRTPLDLLDGYAFLVVRD